MRLWHTLIYLIVFSLFLQGCTSVDHSQFFAAYERDFKARTPYIIHSIKRDEFRLHAREFGMRGDQPSLIMMHGFPDSLHLYDRLIPELADNRHIIAFDFLGWGDSDKPEGHNYNVASLRRDLEAVVSHFNLKKAVLVLHDSSGQPGIDWALDNESRVAGLVLLNTYYSPMSGLRAPDAIKTFSTPGLKRDIAVWVTNNFDSRWISGLNKQLAKFISKKEQLDTYQKILGHQSLQIRPAFFGLNRVFLDEIKQREERIPELAEFKPPVRIIFGNDDHNLNAGVAEEFGKIFPNSELYIMKDAGHFVQVDDPVGVAELLKAFPVSDTEDTAFQLKWKHVKNTN